MRLVILVLMMAALIGCEKKKATNEMSSDNPKNNNSSTSKDSSNDPATSTKDDTEQWLKKVVRDRELGILHWNIESGGSDPEKIGDQLLELAAPGRYQVFALSEVDKSEVYKKKFETLGEAGQWRSILGKSGVNGEREDDRLMIFFDSSRLKLVGSQELVKHGDFNLNTGRHRSPLVAHFECRRSNEQFLLIHNHLARGDGEFRAEQAAGLREFARNNSMAKIAVGDYNFDFVFETRKGNEGFVEFLRDGVWNWIEPDQLIDTNWYDPESDGIDNYPGSILDFTFVSGKAKDWDVTSTVVVRDGDFPDDEWTSDHRPVAVIVRY